MTKHLVDPEWLKLEVDEKIKLEHISAWEKHYNATFVIETTIKNKNDCWIDQPVMVFYTEEPHPQGSNYLGITRDQWTGKWYVVNAITAIEGTIPAYKTKSGRFKWSHYVHDYRAVIPEHLWIDGGRDYTRLVGNIEHPDAEPVELTIENGKVYYERLSERV